MCDQERENSEYTGRPLERTNAHSLLIETLKAKKNEKESASFSSPSILRKPKQQLWTFKNSLSFGDIIANIPVTPARFFAQHTSKLLETYQNSRAQPSSSVWESRERHESSKKGGKG